MTGRYVTLDRVHLTWPPEPPPPLLIGAEGPKTLGVAARVGDGIISTWIDDATFVHDRELALAARSADGTARRGLEHVCTLITATGPSAAERADAELRRWLRKPSPDMVAVGDARSIAASIRRRAGLGAGTIVLQPTADEPDQEALIGFLGTEVKSLVESW